MVTPSPVLSCGRSQQPSVAAARLTDRPHEASSPRDLLHHPLLDPAKVRSVACRMPRPPWPCCWSHADTVGNTRDICGNELTAHLSRWIEQFSSAKSVYWQHFKKISDRLSTDLRGAGVEVVAEPRCAWVSGFCAVRWNVDGVAASKPASGKKCFPLSRVRRQRRSVHLHQSETARVRNIHKHWWSLNTTIYIYTLTYSRGGGKLVGKVLHLCCVDLVVKVNDVAPLLLPRWDQDADSIICN